MPDFTKLAEQYIATWNETDPSVRRALIGQLWSPDGRYIDPLADASGPDQINAVISAAQAQFGGMTFRLASAVDAHHDQARFGWELGRPAPTPWRPASTWPSGMATGGWRWCWGSWTRCRRREGSPRQAAGS